VILFFLPGPPLALTALTLLIALYLTVVELRDLRPHYLWWSWWLLLVFLSHFIGYLALRGYVAYRRSHGARAQG
jgi:hypothetical protein